MANKKKKRRVLSYLFSYDMNLIVAVLFLIVFGLVMIYSASYYTASMSDAFRHDPTYLLMSQLKYSIVGIAVMLVIANVDYHFWRHFAHAWTGGIDCADFAAIGAGTGRHGQGRNPLDPNSGHRTVPGGGAGEGGDDSVFSDSDRKLFQSAE